MHLPVDGAAWAKPARKSSAAGRQLGQPLTGHTDTVWEVAVGTVDNKAIAVTGSMDYAVKVWDLTAL
ncbi:hypothetical protein [Nonomuraea sp. NPDC049158]|uniref:hypothetical protein n=1 Tax=Nonomuraea sp. NPDC049158 TaxID=3155649 RepID=UPI0033D76E54